MRWRRLVTAATSRSCDATIPGSAISMIPSRRGGRRRRIDGAFVPRWARAVFRRKYSGTRPIFYPRIEWVIETELARDVTYAMANGGGRAGIIETNFREE